MKKTIKDQSSLAGGKASARRVSEAHSGNQQGHHGKCISNREVLSIS